MLFFGELSRWNKNLCIYYAGELERRPLLLSDLFGSCFSEDAVLLSSALHFVRHGKGRAALTRRPTIGCPSLPPAQRAPIRRSLKISQRIEELRLMLSQFGVDVKTSKSAVLSEATDYIAHLQRQHAQSEAERAM